MNRGSESSREQIFFKTSLQLSLKLNQANHSLIIQ